MTRDLVEREKVLEIITDGLPGDCDECRYYPGRMRCPRCREPRSIEEDVRALPAATDPRAEAAIRLAEAVDARNEYTEVNVLLTQGGANHHGGDAFLPLMQLSNDLYWAASDWHDEALAAWREVNSS